MPKPAKAKKLKLYPKLKPKTKYFVIFSAVATMFVVCINIPLIEVPSISQVQTVSEGVVQESQVSGHRRISILQVVWEFIRQEIDKLR